VTSSTSELVLDTIEETLEWTDLVLHEDAIRGLYPQQREDMKRNVAATNVSWKTSGAAIRACASTLYEIKNNCGAKNFAALIRNGDLDFSKDIAESLVRAHEWLSSSSIPDRFLTNISARTLGDIAREKNPAILNKITEMIIEVEGKGVSEADIRKLRKKGVKVNRSKAGKAAKKGLDSNATKDEAIEYYTRIVNQMQAQLDQRAEQFRKSVLANQDKAAEIGRLKEQIKELKAGS